jgi:ACDE family multidrug resistance protein
MIQAGTSGGWFLKSDILPTLITLSAVPFVMVLSNSMLIPVLPRMQSAMGLTMLEAGLVITAFSVPAGLSIPVAGYLSDRWSRKVIMIPGLFLFGLGGLVAGIVPLFFSRPYPWIMVGRVLQGIGAGGTYQLSMALTGDIFRPRERSKVLGILESANGLGKVISPILGSAAALIAWYSPFYVYPALAWPVAVAVHLVVKEKPGQSSPESLEAFLKGLKEVLSKHMAPLAAVFLAGFTVLFLLFGSLSFLSDELERAWHMTGITKGLAISVPVLGMTVTAYLAGFGIRKSVRKLTKPADVTGMALLFASLCIIPWVGSVYVLYLSLVALGIGAGLVLPALNLLVTSAAQQSRGTLTALYGTVRFFGAALGPPAVGLGLGTGEVLTFLVGAGLALASAVFLFMVDQAALIPQGMEALPQGQQPQESPGGGPPGSRRPP